MDKADDPKMAEDKQVLEVVRLLDEACKMAGFFYVVHLIINSGNFFNLHNFILSYYAIASICLNFKE